MKFSKALLAAIVLACCIAPGSAGRVILVPSYQELLDKSDLVILAQATATNDTSEQIGLPGFEPTRDHRRPMAPDRRAA